MPRDSPPRTPRASSYPACGTGARAGAVRTAAAGPGAGPRSGARAAADVPADMRGLLAGGQAVLDRLRTCLDAVAAMSADEQEALRAAGVLQAWEDTVFLPPVTDPSIILSIGLFSHRIC